MPSSSSSVVIVSKCIIYPDKKSSLKSLKLSVSDLPMLSCHYIQKGVLLSNPPVDSLSLLTLLKLSLSKTLSFFPPLAGRFHTDDDSGHVHILCNDSGVEFVHAKAMHLSASDDHLHLLLPRDRDVPPCFKQFFQYDNTLSYSGHHNPLLAVQVTELNGGVFIGCTMNHALVDGTSFWNFFNTFAEVARGAKKISRPPCYSRDTVFNSPATLTLPSGGPSATFSGDEPLRERIFHFTKESISRLKLAANRHREGGNHSWLNGNGKVNGKSMLDKSTAEISSFQSLCALLWRSVTRARNLDVGKITTFRMAINCRHRIEPRMDPFYFGNAIQSIPTAAAAGELLARHFGWGAGLLHDNVVAHEDATVRQGIKDWKNNPRLFPLGNFDGAMITMGSSPRFPMYDNDFGWGRPLAVRSGRANKFDGKISAFPGQQGNGSVDLEVVLAPHTLAALENDSEFMQYVATS